MKLFDSPSNRHHIRHQHQRESHLGSSPMLKSNWSIWTNLSSNPFKLWEVEESPSFSPTSSSTDSTWVESSMSSTIRSLMDGVIYQNGGDGIDGGPTFTPNPTTSSSVISNDIVGPGLLESNSLRTTGNGTSFWGNRDPTSYMDTFGGNFPNRSFLSVADAGQQPMDSFQSYLYSIVIPLMLLFCLVSTLINLLIVLSVRWCRKPMSPTLYFSFSLALADAYASSVLGTGLIINSLLPEVYKIESTPCFSLTLEAFRLGGVMVTVAHLLALSINYWIGIVRPLQYAATMTRGTALKVIISSWICPIALLLLYFSSFPGQGFQSNQCEDMDFLYQQTFRVIIAVFFFTPLILMTGIYGHIFVIVRNHLSYNVKYQNCLQLRRNVKAIVTTCLILGTYIIGWMPAIVWYVLVCENCLFPTRRVSVELSIPVNIVINVLVILKALLDPIIYALRMTDIQVALKKMRYDFFLWIFESCAPPRSPPKPAANEIGSVCFTKSIRLSSRRSSSRSNV